VWLTPELFNVSLVFYALFLWCYKEVAGDRPVFTASFLRSARSDYLAAALVGVLTFSKPPHAILMFPLVALAVSQRQLGRALGMSVVWAALAGGRYGAGLADRFQAHLGRWGDRGLQELKLEQPNPRQRPEQLLRVVGAYARQDVTAAVQAAGSPAAAMLHLDREGTRGGWSCHTHSRRRSAPRASETRAVHRDRATTPWRTRGSRPRPPSGAPGASTGSTAPMTALLAGCDARAAAWPRRRPGRAMSS